MIQLNRLSWRSFVKRPNPVAAALMVKMKIVPRDRPKVKLECLRLLATLQLDPARSKLIGAFIDTYLILTAEEMKQYERAFSKLAPKEKEATVEMVSSWEQKGMEHVVLRLLRRRLGDLPTEVEQRINRLSADQIDALTDAVFDIQSVDQVATWLSRQTFQ